VPKLNLMLRSDSAEARDFYLALGYSHDDVVARMQAYESEDPAAGVT
jgi:hypothetical protein